MASPISTALTGINSSQFDLDAITFLTAAAITDATQRYSINNLVTGLKLNSLWTKMQAIYPFVGGTSTTHKWNLKDPRNLDAAFRLTFNGGITHNSNGITPNGTNGYSNTFYTPSTSGSLNDQHISVYSRTSSTADNFDIGCIQSSTNNQLYLQLKQAGGSQIAINDAQSFPTTWTNSLGLFTGSRSDSANHHYNRNEVRVSSVKAVVARPNTTILLSNINTSSGPAGSGWSTRNLAWASIGSSLSATDVTNLYTVVQAYQTALSRQV
jgi:hypothetical protein